MIYISHNESDLFALSQEIFACLLAEGFAARADRTIAIARATNNTARERQRIPSRVRIDMFVEPSYEWNGVGKQVEEHLREIIDYDRRLSELQGVDIQVTIKESEQFTREASHAEGIAMAQRAHEIASCLATAKSNVIGLVFQLDYT